MSNILRTALDGSLSPQQAKTLLMGRPYPRVDQALCRSTALLTALHNSAAWFVDSYVMHVANTTLPDDVKQALLSGRDVNTGKENEIKACMTAANPATREAYKRQVEMSTLPAVLKEYLLGYC